jgi:propanol-preferring alcohol dehydrogenase
MSTDTMWAMALQQPGAPLQAIRLPLPVPGKHDVLIHVNACGVCRTDLHIVDGELPPRQLPLVPGHEVVGTVVRTGAGVIGLAPGDRVGVPWLGSSCGHCRYCLAHRENLCDDARFTGYDLQGGYAEYLVADARYCFPLPGNYDPIHLAPLLCAGLIGYRAYAMAGDAECIGLYGFGAAAHLVAQVARHEGRRVFAFTRPGDVRSQEFARTLGTEWAGDSNRLPPVLLDAAILFAPVGGLVPQSLAAVRKGGSVVCAGIHMSDIPGFPYALLWGERCVRSVANLTRADGEAFFRIAQQIDLHTTVVPYSMKEANRALEDLRSGAFDGAAVLINNF